MRRTVIGILALAALGLGCSEQPDDHVPTGGPPAITGGSLEVTAMPDGHFFAVAGDPARASIYIADLTAGTEEFRVLLEADDEPGRIAIDGSGRAHVVGRRSGDVITIDIASGEIVDRRRACAAPRGIDVDVDEGNDLWVACAEGIVVRMPQAGGGVTETVKLVPDLRDVVAQTGNRLYVSRFRAAEILVVEDGAIRETFNAPGASDTTGRVMESTVAWRMRRIGTGNEVLLVHQQSQTTQLGTLAMPSSGAQYYSSNCRLGVVRTYVSSFNGNRFDDGQPVEDTTLAVDGAVAGRTIALAAAAERGTPADASMNTPDYNGVRSVSMDGMGTGGVCPMASAAAHFDRARAATSVAVLPDGHIATFYRDPAEIVVGRIDSSFPESPFGGGVGSQDVVTTRVALSGGRVEHAGHALMHEAVAGTGTACASCHPEGGDDGHTWAFDVGNRRTQTLTGGILDTAPFHWSGDVADMRAIMQGGFVTRMGGVMPHDDELAQLETWVDQALPAVPGIVEDAEQVDRGHRVFMDVGCAGCHDGDKRTNNQLSRPSNNAMEPDIVRLDTVAVPALYEVMYHAPYFHNGSVEDLDELVSMHEMGTDLDETQRTDLVAYLRSL